MIRMIKGNVERIVNTEAQKKKLLAFGYLIVENGSVETDKNIDTVDNSEADKKVRNGGNSENIPLEEMTVAQLRDIAAENNINGCENMNKKALLESVRLLYKE